MNESIPSKTSSNILEKINRLCGLLLKEQTEFEQAATLISDHALRCTVLTLAQNNHQYACELSSHVLCMQGIEIPGGLPPLVSMMPASPADTPTLFNNEHEVLDFCRMNEKKMVFAYRDILNDLTLYDGLRKMIRYQLNGILVSFMQLRLLNSLTIA